MFTSFLSRRTASIPRLVFSKVNPINVTIKIPPRCIEFSPVACHSFHWTSSPHGLFSPRDDISFWGRTLKKLGFTDIPKSILKRAGWLMYMKTADGIDYLKFFEHCDLPDTYASWFIVIELHVWMLSAKLMQHDREGRVVRNSLIKAMWEDNTLKSKRLEGALPSARKKEIQDLNQQFQAVMFSYDEGLMGNDKILAGALWRRFLRPHFYDKTVSLEQRHFIGTEHEDLAKKVKALEMLVIYVRSQFYMLNNLSREQLVHKRAFKWAPFDDTLFDLVTKVELTPAAKKEAMKVR